MAITRMTLAQALAKPPSLDQAKLDATTEEDIRRYQEEDGEIPELPPGPATLVVPPAVARERLGLSQPDFAALIGVPVETLQRWEQDYRVPDPAARALMVVLYREPEAALRALTPLYPSRDAAE